MLENSNLENKFEKLKPKEEVKIKEFELSAIK